MPTTGSSATTRPARSRILSLGLKNHPLRRTKDGCFFGANFPASPDVLHEETRFDPAKKDSSPNARKARWEELMARHKGKIDVELGKVFETDNLDVITGRHEANERTLCGRVEVSPRGVPEWDWAPFYPGGTVQSKVADASMAERMALSGAGRAPWVGLPRWAVPGAAPRIPLDGGTAP